MIDFLEYNINKDLNIFVIGNGPKHPDFIAYSFPRETTIIVRFNMYHMKDNDEFHDHSLSHIIPDIHVTTAESKFYWPESYKKTPPSACVFYPPHSIYHTTDADNLVEKSKLMGINTKFYTYPISVYKTLPVHFPSTGTATLILLRKMFSNNIYVDGFNFYRKNNSVEKRFAHDFPKEERLIYKENFILSDIRVI